MQYITNLIFIIVLCSSVHFIIFIILFCVFIVISILMLI